MTPPKYMTEEACQERHGSTRLRWTVLFAFISCIAVASGYVVIVADMARSLAGQTETELKVHAAGDSEYRHGIDALLAKIDKSLDEVKGDVRDIKKDQSALLRNHGANK